MIDETKIAKLDGTDSTNDLMQLAKVQLASINGLSEQMGLMNARMNKFETRLDDIQESVDGVKAEITVTRSQANRLRRSIHERVATVLKLEREGGRVADSSIHDDVAYRKAFISRLYFDAREKSKLGTPYYDTLRADFAETMDYITSWFPEVEGGTDGYKRYLDIRHKESI